MGNTSKFELAICEIFNPKKHGFTHTHEYYMNSHYIIHITVSSNDFLNKSFNLILLNLIQYYFYYRRESVVIHPIIRNYHHILQNINNVKIDIIQKIYMPGGEETVCIKTFWIKLLQRKWKRIYKERIIKIQNLKKPYALFTREITGKS